MHDRVHWLDVPALMTTRTILAADLINRPVVFDDPSEFTKNGKRIEHRRAANPNWVLPSWLFLDEIHRSIAHAGLITDNLDFSFKVILNAMVDFEKALGARRTRLVFWFDN